MAAIAQARHTPQRSAAPNTPAPAVAPRPSAPEPQAGGKAWRSVRGGSGSRSSCCGGNPPRPARRGSPQPRATATDLRPESGIESRSTPPTPRVPAAPGQDTPFKPPLNQRRRAKYPIGGTWVASNGFKAPQGPAALASYNCGTSSGEAPAPGPPLPTSGRSPHAAPCGLTNVDRR